MGCLKLVIAAAENFLMILSFIVIGKIIYPKKMVCVMTVFGMRKMVSALIGILVIHKEELNKNETLCL